MKTNLLIALLLTCSIGAFSQMSVLNGSFESISPSVVNMTCLNDSAWTVVNNSMGLPGGTQSLVISDTITDPACGVAQQGLNYVDLPTSCPSATVVDHIGISLELSQSFVEGSDYRISFYAKKCDPTTTSAPVNIGYSSDPASFGTVLFTSPLVDSNTWQYFEYVFTFTASSSFNNSYLTVTTESPVLPIVPFSIQLDNFNVEEINTASITNDVDDLNMNVYPNPSYENVMIDFGNDPFTGTLFISDLTGSQILIKELIVANNYPINKNSFGSAGVYILTAKSSTKHKTIFQKIVIR